MDYEEIIWVVGAIILILFGPIAAYWIVQIIKKNFG